MATLHTYAGMTRCSITAKETKAPRALSRPHMGKRASLAKPVLPPKRAKKANKVVPKGEPEEEMAQQPQQQQHADTPRPEPAWSHQPWTYHPGQPWVMEPPHPIYTTGPTTAPTTPPAVPPMGRLDLGWHDLLDRLIMGKCPQEAGGGATWDEQPATPP